MLGHSEEGLVGRTYRELLAPDAEEASPFFRKDGGFWVSRAGLLVVLAIWLAAGVITALWIARWLS